MAIALLNVLPSLLPPPTPPKPVMILVIQCSNSRINSFGMFMNIQKRSCSSTDLRQSQTKSDEVKSRNMIFVVANCIKFQYDFITTVCFTYTVKTFWRGCYCGFSTQLFLAAVRGGQSIRGQPQPELDSNLCQRKSCYLPTYSDCG